MIKKIEHVAVVVKHMEESIRYYSEMFGYQVKFTGKNERREMTFLVHGDQPGMEIELIRDLISLGDYSAQGLVNHIAFTVDSMEDAIRFYKGKGIVFHSEQANKAINESLTIFFSGPSGELLQLVEPPREEQV